MTLLYKYDSRTKEYIGHFPAYLDPLESQLQGCDIIVVPPCSTLVPVPEFIEGEESPIYDEVNNTWIVLKDYRGFTGFNKKTGAPIEITELGDLPEVFTAEKPMSISDLKDKKLNELKKVAEEEHNKEVLQKGILIKTEDKSKFISMKETMHNTNFATINNQKDEAIALNVEQLDNIIKYLEVKSLLIPIIRAELAKEIRSCKSKKQLEALKLDFKLEERIKELMKLSTEEIDKYVEENTK